MRTEGNTYFLSKVELVALIAHARRDGTRPGQDGVWLDGPRAWATDGARLAVLSEAAYGAVKPRAEAGPERVMLPLETAKLLVKAALAKADIEVCVAGGKLACVAGVARVEIPVPPVRAPSIDQSHVLPDYRAEERLTAAHAFAVNPASLANLELVLKAAQPLRGDPSTSVYVGASPFDVVCFYVGDHWTVAMAQVNAPNLLADRERRSAANNGESPA